MDLDRPDEIDPARKRRAAGVLAGVAAAVLWLTFSVGSVGGLVVTELMVQQGTLPPWASQLSQRLLFPMVTVAVGLTYTIVVGIYRRGRVSWPSVVGWFALGGLLFGTSYVTDAWWMPFVVLFVAVFVVTLTLQFVALPWMVRALFRADYDEAKRRAERAPEAVGAWILANVELERAAGDGVAAARHLLETQRFNGSLHRWLLAAALIREGRFDEASEIEDIAAMPRLETVPILLALEQEDLDRDDVLGRLDAMGTAIQTPNLVERLAGHDPRPGHRAFRAYVLARLGEDGAGEAVDAALADLPAEANPRARALWYVATAARLLGRDVSASFAEGASIDPDGWWGQRCADDADAIR